MSKAIYWQRGEDLDYKNGTSDTIEAGSVVSLKTRIAIAGMDIRPGEVGSIHVKNVFKFDKTDSAEIQQGTAVYWDGNGITATEGSNVPAGYAAYDSTAENNTILVNIG